MNILHSVLSVH